MVVIAGDRRIDQPRRNRDTVYDPFFLAAVGSHIALGLTCVVVGALAMLSKKQRGRHSRFGKIYFWLLLALFASATVLAVMR